MVAHERMLVSTGHGKWPDLLRGWHVHGWLMLAHAGTSQALHCFPLLWFCLTSLRRHPTGQGLKVVVASGAEGAQGQEGGHPKPAPTTDWKLYLVQVRRPWGAWIVLHAHSRCFIPTAVPVLLSVIVWSLSLHEHLPTSSITWAHLGCSAPCMLLGCSRQLSIRLHNQNFKHLCPLTLMQQQEECEASLAPCIAFPSYITHTHTSRPTHPPPSCTNPCTIVAHRLRSQNTGSFLWSFSSCRMSAKPACCRPCGRGCCTTGRQATHPGRSSSCRFCWTQPRGWSTCMARASSTQTSRCLVGPMVLVPCLLATSMFLLGQGCLHAGRPKAGAPTLTWFRCHEQAP